MPIINFKGKTAVENYHHTIPHHALEFVDSLSVMGKGQVPSLDENLLIEGDNLFALKALLPTHAGKVKCIYIDPPYNTGNENWVFNDNLSQPQFKDWLGKIVGREGEDATRHDKWSCMMYPRLQLLKELLKDDGAIFVSIDDNEVHNLRLLMEEIFGAENFIAQIVWQKRYSRENREAIGDAHEYILVYAKNPVLFKQNRNKLEPTDQQKNVYRNPNNDPKGLWRPIPMTAQAGNSTPDQYYKIKAPGGKIHTPPPGRCWGIAQGTFEDLLKKGRIYFGLDNNSQPNVIRYLSEVDGFVPWTWWPHEEVGHTDEASKEVTEIIGASAIQGTPKPVRLIKRIIEMYTDANANDIVLDSFAGSGTTAHAVLQANMVDGGNRRFILIQQPFDTKDNKSEKFNICKSVTGERVRKVILGYKSANKRKEKILEKQITLDVLRKPEGLLAEIEKVKEKLASRYNDFKIEIVNDTVSLIGQPSKEGKVKGLGGSFTYVRVGDPLLTEYRTFQGKRPSYEKLASYIYYTETNRQLNQKTLDKSESLIGSIGETAFFLLYDEKAIDGLSLTLDWLESKSTKYKHKSWVIYTERIWIHRDDREAFEKRAGKYVRLMHLPFHLK